MSSEMTSRTMTAANAPSEYVVPELGARPLGLVGVASGHMRSLPLAKQMAVSFWLSTSTSLLFRTHSARELSSWSAEALSVASSCPHKVKYCLESHDQVTDWLMMCDGEKSLQRLLEQLSMMPLATASVRELVVRSELIV